MKNYFSGKSLKSPQKLLDEAFNWQVDTELNELFIFFERTRGEVFGHESSQPEGEIAAALVRFAQGECNAEERSQMCEALRQNPSWLRWLAERVKSGRNDSAPETGNNGI